MCAAMNRRFWNCKKPAKRSFSIPEKIPKIPFSHQPIRICSNECSPSFIAQSSCERLAHVSTPVVREELPSLRFSPSPIGDFMNRDTITEHFGESPIEVLRSEVEENSELDITEVVSTFESLDIGEISEEVVSCLPLPAGAPVAEPQDVCTSEEKAKCSRVSPVVSTFEPLDIDEISEEVVSCLPLPAGAPVAESQDVCTSEEKAKCSRVSPARSEKASVCPLAHLGTDLPQYVDCNINIRRLLIPIHPIMEDILTAKQH